MHGQFFAGMLRRKYEFVLNGAFLGIMVQIKKADAHEDETTKQPEAPGG